MARKQPTQTQEELKAIQEASQRQALPEQKRVFSVSEKIRRRVHNLPDPTRPPLGYDEHKAFDRVFPYVRLPRLHPPNHGDTIIFNAPELPANQLILGDNLEVLRTLPSESIDLIYIDPPFFSGRTYNVIWGDTNEVRTFYDIWEGGIDTYLVWLNARLWEMKRVLKKTGSIYVHCDWHASHYIKCEMDKIFGYENFRNEIKRKSVFAHNDGKQYGRNSDSILFYVKSRTDYFFKVQCIEYDEEYLDKTFRNIEPETGRRYQTVTLTGAGEGPPKFFLGKLRYPPKNRHWAGALGYSIEELEKMGRLILSKNDVPRVKYYPEDTEGKPLQEFWDDAFDPQSQSKENLGYPTQKSEEVLYRIIGSSCPPDGVVADFFCGGGTTCAVAMKLNRRFIGCDSSRVAIAVTLDRLVKIGEEMSGVKSNISTGGAPVEEKLQMAGAVAKVPNIEVSYLGVYPLDKFEHLSQDDFVDFVLTCYGASRHTGEGIAHGFRPPGQSEPILVGPANPRESIDAHKIKEFFDEIKSRLEPNKPVRAKILGWRFSRQVQEYVKILQKYVEDNRLVVEDDGSPLIEIELIPLRSNRFRERILQRYRDVEEADFYLRFPEPPVIGDIRIKKIGPLEYEFEAVDAMSTNEDGWLVNCQWDFDYQEGHFAADKDYILSRQKVKSRVRGAGDRFEAILTARHKFAKPGTYTVACKVQDNLAGEAVFSKRVDVNN
jgi:DNA modification methylase